MNPLEFLTYAVENWVSILSWTIFFEILLFFGIRKLCIGGIFDPLHLSYTFTFGTKYAVIFALYFNGLIENYLFFMIVFFGLSFYAFLIYSSKLNQPVINNLFLLLVPKNNSNFEFKFIFFIYILVSFYIIYNIGFGFFAETNRFDNNRGFGAFVRITDVLGTFIIAYLGLLFYKRYENLKRNDLGQYLRYLFLFIFISFFTILNGAKAAFIFAIITIILSIRITGAKLKITFLKGLIIFSIAAAIGMLGLYINLVNNQVQSSGAGQYTGAPIVIEQFVARIIANGNQSYMSLPNNVIEEIETDSIFIRVVSQIIGSSVMSKILGYDVTNYSVGRQILLYYDSKTEVAGGPTSHFDLFSYVYFGYFGVLFIVFLAYILGTFQRLLKFANDKSIFYVALLSTLWIRSMAVILEPVTGLAYIIDILIIFFLLHIFIYILNIISHKGNKNVFR